MTIQKKLLEELETRRQKALRGGGEREIRDRRNLGLLTARERLAEFFGPGTFQETGLYARHQCHDFGMQAKEIPGDAVVTGTGHVDGRLVAAFSQDFTMAGGSLGKIHAQKICDIMDTALKTGVPVIGFNDSSGARIQEGVDSLSGYGQVFFRNVLLSGVVPQISIVAGPCAGGAAYSPAMTDFVIMTRKHANMFICGPEVIKTVTGQAVSVEDIGSASMHASTSGNIHFLAEDDLHAIQITRKLLSFLPSNNLMDPPHHLTPEVALAPVDPLMDDLLPESSKDAFDVRKIIGRIVDEGDFLEVQRNFARNIVVGFGRIGGVVVGIVASQPIVKAGAIDIDASDKAARFVRFCNCFNIPLISLMDVPGFMPGVAQECGGIIRHGAKMLFAYAAATVPKITIIMRKAYGGSYHAMGSKDMGADKVFAWPLAEIAVMGAEGAVNILYREEIRAAANPQNRKAELIAEYREKFASPYQAAAKNMVTDVILPSQTRSVVGLALRNILSKRETRPPKKHGNIPL
jgi:propionyl-CoA carboxylase beta chain